MSSMEAVEGSAGPSRPPSTRDVLNSLQEQIALMQQTINEQAAQLEDRTPVTNIEKKFNKKVEVIADPGQYTGEKARFAEWWTKMRIWLRANADALSECLISDEWPDQHEILAEIENFFLPQNEQDWARPQIQSCKQGNLRVDEYISKWLSLYQQSKISEEHTVYLLEINTNPHIIKQVFILGGQADTVNAYLEHIQTIGRAQESFLMFQPLTKTQGRAWGNNASGSKTYGGQGEPMDIGAATKGRGAGSSECYKCGKGGHFACDCKAPNCRCGSHHHTSERHPAGQGKGKGLEVRSTSASNDAPQSQADFKQMDFEEAKAFFYDMQVAEMKSQGKGFGP
ncbi:hypothetical protein HYDPIDRAFT_31828 [Hydnomerulius pinastri MD-312]|uniref:CCHC-type domain-containing protein n=1 Tax=Hydnomerulius pinastri MD-312 TaxID=994086 RepID=A0A0C9W3T8_9AGAM|nr:hypothetical protein HYDPIDRAFT_31828 [Hydnomerulius pinastri MD-312]